MKSFVELAALIAAKELPLEPQDLQQAKDFCDEQVVAGFLTVLGRIPDILRQDWLDESLDPLTRAIGHVKVDPYFWKSVLETVCSQVIASCNGETVAVFMWRGALAFLKTVLAHQIVSYHMDVKRNEHTLQISMPLPLSSFAKEALEKLAREKGRVLIPDVMLASGSSACFAIDLLKAMGFLNHRITVACVVAAPEGVFCLQNRYPGIAITTAVLDDHLNESAYILPGLGDAGDKYFAAITPGDLPRGEFTAQEWAHLQTYF